MAASATFRCTDRKGIVMGTWKPNQPAVLSMGDTMDRNGSGQYSVRGVIVQCNDTMLDALKKKGRLVVMD